MHFGTGKSRHVLHNLLACFRVVRVARIVTSGGRRSSSARVYKFSLLCFGQARQARRACRVVTCRGVAQQVEFGLYRTQRRIGY